MMNKLDKKWQLKIVCLLLAIILWFLIINEQNPVSEGSYTVPVVIENLDSQYITSNVPKTVYVRLSGPRNTIINVGPSDIKAYIDLADAQEGDMDVPIHVEIPSGTELKKQSMASAKITVDVYAVREFNLTPHLVGKMDEDSFISSLKIVPEKVVVSGARRLIQKVDKAVVEIPVGDKNEDFSLMAQIHLLAADGSKVEGLEMTPWQSNLRVSIGHNAAVKTVPVHVTSYGIVGDGMTLKGLKVNPDALEVRGDAKVLQGVSRIDLTPVNVQGLTENKEWKILVSPINGVIVEPDVVNVTATVEE